MKKLNNMRGPFGRSLGASDEAVGVHLNTAGAVAVRGVWKPARPPPLPGLTQGPSSTKRFGLEKKTDQGQNVLALIHYGPRINEFLKQLN